MVRKKNLADSSYVTKKDIDKLGKSMQIQFNSIDERFIAVDKRFDAVDERFKAVDKRFDRLEIKIDEKNEELRRHMGVLHEQIRDDIRTVLEIVVPKLDKVNDHENRIVQLEEDMAIVKQVV